jgi:hypothetical protein
VKIFENPIDESILQNPMPIFYRIRNWILGENIPSRFVKWIFYINFGISILFLGWHFLGFLSVFFRNTIFSNKQILVDEIIQQNAEKLGYTAEELVRKMELHHIFSLVIWILICWALALFWRRNNKAIFYFLFLFLIYFLQGIYFFGWSFIKLELTAFDWYSILIFAILIAADKLIPYLIDKED